jgi:uncharacterized protein (TIGR00725 family)
VKARGKIVTVFGSSRPHAGDDQYAAALALGRELARKGFVVLSGGYGGVMEAVSRGTKEAGGRTLAITATFFKARANRWVDEEIRVKTWQERLFELVKRGHGYVACRGGTGTLAAAARCAWRFLGAGDRARARSRVGPQVSVGRTGGAADPHRCVARRCGRASCRATDEALTFAGSQFSHRHKRYNIPTRHSCRIQQKRFSNLTG